MGGKINNIGKLFYKDYYKGVNFNDIFNDNVSNIEDDKNSPFQNINRKIIKGSKRVDIPPVFPVDNPVDNEDAKFKLSSFKAKIEYPGLVTGTGLVHDSKKLKGAFNLGMHFDYTYGMPIVYGSSVKGVLRTYFKEFSGEFNVPEEDIDDLFEAIFNGKERDLNKLVTEDGKPNYRSISIYKRDIFFDAVIVEEASNGTILDDDSITPHGDNPLKNPIPITMLKIAPGCVLEFRFFLNETTLNTGRKYNAEFKLTCFKKILETVGVGAKTNVGYGQLTVCDPPK